MTNEVFLRDLDGTGSMHACSNGDPGAVTYVPQTEVEELRASLRQMRAMFGVIVDELDIDPADTKVAVKVVRPAGEQTVASVSLADCFAEADRLTQASN